MYTGSLQFLIRFQEEIVIHGILVLLDTFQVECNNEVDDWALNALGKLLRGSLFSRRTRGVRVVVNHLSDQKHICHISFSWCVNELYSIRLLRLKYDYSPKQWNFSCREYSYTHLNVWHQGLHPNIQKVRPVSIWYHPTLIAIVHIILNNINYRSEKDWTRQQQWFCRRNMRLLESILTLVAYVMNDGEAIRGSGTYLVGRCTAWQTVDWVAFLLPPDIRKSLL